MTEHQSYMAMALEDASIGGFSLGRYTVESFMEFMGRRFELVTGVLQAECEAVRIEWAKAQGLR